MVWDPRFCIRGFSVSGVVRDEMPSASEGRLSGPFFVLFLEKGAGCLIWALPSWEQHPATRTSPFFEKVLKGRGLVALGPC